MIDVRNLDGSLDGCNLVLDDQSLTGGANRIVLSIDHLNGYFIKRVKAWFDEGCGGVI